MTLFIRMLCLLSLITPCQLLAAQPADTSSTTLARAIQDRLDRAVANGRIPGAVFMLARGERLSYLGTSGVMGPGTPMRGDAIVPLASVGKMYTATAALILVESGVMSLDDPVSNYLSEFSDDDDLRVRHLLTHTTGLTLDGPEYWYVWNTHAGETTTREFAADIARLPRTAEPGARFHYGGTGGAYEILGAVIEEASGTTLEDVLHRSLFMPLRMDDTYFFIPDEKVDRLPAFYRKEEGDWGISREMGVEWPRNLYFFGGGGVSAPAWDILKFAQIFLNGGVSQGVRVLSEDSVDQMMSDQLNLNNRGDLSYSWGYGASLPIGTGPSNVSSYSWVGGNYNTLLIDKPSGLVFWVAYPIEPPGDSELLGELRSLVDSYIDSSGNRGVRH